MGSALVGMGRESMPSQVDFYSGGNENIGDIDPNLKKLSPVATLGACPWPCVPFRPGRPPIAEGSACVLPRGHCDRS